MVKNTLATTGSCPCKLPWGTDEAHPACIKLKQDILDSLEQLVKNGVDTIYTGMAMGVDIWVAEAVLIP